MTLNDPEHQFTALASSVTCIVTKWLKLKSCGFCYKVVQQFSFLHVKF